CASSIRRRSAGSPERHAGARLAASVDSGSGLNLEGKAMDPIPLNWLAVIVAAIIRMAVGFVWYSPPVLLKPWQAETGVTPETMRAGLTRSMVIDVIASLIMAFALANIIGASGITDWFNGA